MNTKNILPFLIDVQFNNNRNWFQENKERYEVARSEFGNLVNKLITGLKAFDKSIVVTNSKDCMFRFYRDVRFSKNKEPYKTKFGAFIGKDKWKSGYAGYHIYLRPDNSFLAGGILNPNPQILKKVRTGIYNDIDTFKKIINEPKFKQFFPEFYGEKLKNPPKGFSKNFADIDLLKHKSFVTTHPINNKLVTKKELINKVLDAYKILYPFNTFLNEILDKK